jgi:hypothetical protein
MSDETRVRCVEALRAYLQDEHKHSRLYYDENGQIGGHPSLDAIVRVVLAALPGDAPL